MRRYRPLEVSMAGALCFVAGIAVARVFSSTAPWSPTDTAQVTIAVLLLWQATRILRGLYHAQVDPPRRHRPFDVFLAGAACFIASIAGSIAFRSGPWTRADTASVATAGLLVLYAASTLRDLYRAQVPSPRSAPHVPAA